MVKQARWFKRGWCLQELIAPSTVTFYDANWQYLGKRMLRGPGSRHNRNPRQRPERDSTANLVLHRTKNVMGFKQSYNKD